MSLNYTGNKDLYNAPNHFLKSATILAACNRGKPKDRNRAGEIGHPNYRETFLNK